MSSHVERVLVGMYTITREEYAQLNMKTSHSPANEDEFLITLEVFHQLHCLVWLNLPRIILLRIGAALSRTILESFRRC